MDKWWGHTPTQFLHPPPQASIHAAKAAAPVGAWALREGAKAASGLLQFALLEAAKAREREKKEKR